MRTSPSGSGRTSNRARSSPPNAGSTARTRASAQQGNAEWYAAERDKEFTFILSDDRGQPQKDEKGADKQVTVPFKDIHPLAPAKAEKKADEKDTIRVVLSDTLYLGIQHQAAIALKSAELSGRKLKWASFEEWVQARFGDVYLQGRVWAEAKQAEEDEKDQFSAKKPQKAEKKA